MLGDQRVNCRHAGDVDNREFGASLDDFLEQSFHHHARSGAVKGTDERQSQNTLPYLYDGSRQLEHLFLLAPDHFLTGLLVDLRRIKAELVDQEVGCPYVFDLSGRIPSARLSESVKKGLLK